MAKNEKQNIFWIKTGETFAGHGQGEDITDYFYDADNKPTQPKRLEKLIAGGYVSTEEPVNYESASEMELNQLRKTIAELTEENADLKDELANVPKNITASRKEIKALKSELVEKEIEIENLTATISDLESELIEKDIEIENITKPDPPADTDGGKK